MPNTLEEAISYFCDNFDENAGMNTPAVTLLTVLYNEYRFGQLQQLVEEIGEEVRIVINEAFLTSYQARLRALNGLVLDFTRANDYSILDELHVEARNLYEAFKDYTSLEGILSCWHASIIYMGILRAKYKENTNQINNLLANGQELALWIRPNADRILREFESSVNPCWVFNPSGNNQPYELITFHSDDTSTYFIQFHYGFLDRKGNGIITEFHPRIHLTNVNDIRKAQENLYMFVQEKGDMGLNECNIARNELLGSRMEFANSLHNSMMLFANRCENLIFTE
ncbi:hypothetical protein GH882_11075 [Bacillus thuringiensis]|nr:hypothetical protein [Bacillus thuringiensis]